MSSATMTLIGLNNFLDYQGNDLFANLSFPTATDGTIFIDKETAINNILFMADDKELLYPDANFMINAIGMWSTKWERTFQKWIDVLLAEYNPLENTDRHENWSDSESSSESESSSAYASDSSTGSTSTKNDVSAYNVSTYSPDQSAAEKSDNQATSQSHGNGTTDFKKYSEHGGYIHGNIGTMTTQYLLREELETQRFNIYDEIAIIFIREFCLAL